MIAVITGDIINSRKGKTEDWLKTLKDILNQYGKNPKDWEVFRGDSFQLVLHPKDALIAALHIKASIKQNKLYDVRMAIGLGEADYTAKKITESNGAAYVYSGECFEGLKNQTLAIKSANQTLDTTLNIMFNLATAIANTWSSTVATVIKTAIEHPKKTQKELAEHLKKKSQSTVSEALKRGGFDEIIAIHSFYKKHITL